jgi:A/G-specific adenine glycosylase
MEFSDVILAWYRTHKRELPWRNTREPYLIWLSEIMLQQTRVAQGLPYFLKFVERFPTVEDLAAAPGEEVLKLWQGLGYYSRARNLHATAKTIATEYQGRFPNTYEGLLKLKGIGAYTAAAISSICFQEPNPVVDGNVYRVLSRFFGVDLPVNAPEGTRYFANLAREVMDAEHIGDYNQGLMEFGALQCVPRNPDCTACPLSTGCEAYRTGRVGKLPVKLPKKGVLIRHFNYLVPVDREFRTLLTRRSGPGIWQGLYEFPLVESEGPVPDDGIGDLLAGANLPALHEATSVVRFNPNPIVHKLSHQHLYATFWILHLPGSLEGAVPISQMHSYPVPVLIANFMETVKNSYF